MKTASHTELLEAAIQYYLDNNLTVADLDLVAIAFSVNERALEAKVAAL